MSCYVLIHGAFRGGWCWQPVAGRLRAAGHHVLAPSLTGAGERAHLAAAATSLQVYIDDVVNLLVYEDLHEVILVGHSHGGVVITAASEHCADRLAHLVYVDAPVPRDGECAAELLPAKVRAHFPAPERRTQLPARPVELADAALSAWINARLTPHPVDPSFDPVRLRDAAALALPRSYAFCRDTPAMMPSSYTRARLDAEGTPYVLLPCGHDAPLEAPTAVAELLLGLAT